MGRKRSQSATVELPEPGTVFLMPLGNDRFGACRVLRENAGEERKRHGEPAVLVAGSAWIGTEPPDLADPRLREILHLTHHKWQNAPNANWVSVPPPDDFRAIGILEPDEADRIYESWSSGGWSFAFQTELQWRWDHDRESVLREDAERAAEQLRQRSEAEFQRKAARGALTLAQLRDKRRFSDWKEFVPAKAISGCRLIFRETIDVLLELGAKPPEEKVLPVLQTCVERLNELDVRHEHFIETTIREELCEEFDEIAAACGLIDRKDLADEWREW